MRSNVAAVVVIHRHGARLPSSAGKHDLAFPFNDRFWVDHGMSLVPSGVIQMSRLGSKLAKLYPHLMCNVDAYTTNTSRTIMSALSLLEGMLPHTPKYITHNGDDERETTHYRNVHAVELQVEASKLLDRLFYCGSMHESYMEWKRDNIRNSDLLHSLCRRRDVVNLLDKLFVMSGNPAVSPGEQCVDRLRTITGYYTLVRYASINNSLLLPNKYGLTLDKGEQDMIAELSNHVYRHSFDRDIATTCVGQLLSLVSMLFKDVSDGYAEGGMSIYSAHDTTILAVASALGLDVDSPDFSGRFVLELEGTTVRIYYNTGEQPYVAFSSHGEENSDERPESAMGDLVKTVDVDEMTSMFDYDVLSTVRNVLRNVARSTLAGSSRGGSPRSTLGDTPRGTFSERKLERTFSYYDVDNDGYIDLPEFSLMCKRLGWKHASEEETKVIYDAIGGPIDRTLWSNLVSN